MQAVFVHLFSYSIFSFRKLTFDKLKMVVKKCQLLVFTHMQSETQKYVIGVFPSVEGDETTHIFDGMYSKYMTMSFILEALDWCCGDGCKFSHAHEGFMLMPNEQTKRKIQQKGLCKWSMNTRCLVGSFVEIVSIFKHNLVTSEELRGELGRLRAEGALFFPAARPESAHPENQTWAAMIEPALQGTTFLTRERVETAWTRRFQLVEHLESPDDWQDYVVLRRR